MELQDKQTSESRTSLHHDSIETMDTPQQTFMEKMKRGVRLITVEPVLFLYLFATLLAGGATRNMSFEMACRVDKQLDDTICSNLTLGTKIVSPFVIETYAWNAPIQQAISMILVLCFGTFSDRHKIRKPFMILPILGEVFSCVGLILCAVFISSWPVWTYFFMALILPAFFGGGQTLIMAIFSYISDISTQEDRSSRIGFVELGSLLLTPIGSAVAGILFLNIGYYGIFITCLIFFAMALLYGQAFLKETLPKVDIKLLLDVFNIKTVVVDMFKVLLKKRVAYRRFLLIMSYVCYVLIRGPNGAEGEPFVHYILHTYKWDIAKLGYFKSFDTIVHIIGMFIAVTLFMKKLKMNDYLIVIISCVIRIILGIWYAFGTNVIMFCFGPVIGVFSGLFAVALRSVVTKLVSPSEVAKTQALFAVCEVLCPLIFNKMYSNFFKYTNKAFFGAFFLLTSVLIVIPLVLLLGMYLLYKHDLQHPQPEEQPQDVQQNGTEQYNNDIEIEKL